MKTVPATEAKNRLGAILDEAQRQPIVIQKQDRDVAVVMSISEFQRLRSASSSAFLKLRNEVAAGAKAKGLTSSRLAALLRDDE